MEVCRGTVQALLLTLSRSPLKEWIRTHQKQRAHPSNPKARLHESVLEEEHSTSSTPDIQLAAQTQALQEFFFGSQPPAVPSASNYDPSTNIASPPSSAQASQSEHLQSSSYLLPAQSSSYPLPAQSSSSSPTSQAQARYLQNLEVLSPLPQSPSRPVDTLHRLVVRRGYDTQAQTAHASSSSRAGESTSNAGHAARAPPTLDHPFSSVGSPSFTDYRNTALSPSNFNMHPDSTASPRRPIYTEAEREEARRDLLSQLASQLGNPSPPSADEGTDETHTSGEEVEGTSRQATPVLDLLAVVQSQQANGQSHARGLSQPPDPAPGITTTSHVRAGEGQTTWGQSTSKQPVLPHPIPSMHMLGILNGSASHPQVQTILSNSPSTHTTPANTGNHLLAQQQATSLLNLFNSKSSVSSPASNPVVGNQSGSADLARLFANIRT